ncbi:U3 small nucleolar RNA-associated protein 18 isoform X1 [Pitangus sulphuratus]|nr:U3 small nucleolar RNA-associated protein 18 isoform X1 [Pitangus sulphuratus]
MAKAKAPKRAEEEAEAERRARHLRAVSGAAGAERELEELVFGDSLRVEEDELLRRLGGPPRVAAAEGKSLQADSSDSEVENEAKGDLLPKKPAWVDEDDEAEENVDMTHKYRKDFMKSDAEKTLTKKKLKRRLEEQFQQAMGGVPTWANLENRKKSKRTSSDSESDEDDDLLRRTGNFISSSESLPRGILKVDGIRNPKIQSIYLESFPIYKARFSVDGEQVIATGTHHSMFFVYDMMAGNIIPIPKVRGVEERFLRNFELSPDGSLMLLIGTSGYLHLLSMKIFGRITVTIVLHPTDKGTDQHYEGSSDLILKLFSELIGDCSSSGVVNLYTTDVCLKEHHPKPVKAIMNLVTSATCVTFNPTTEILAVASRDADEAVKLAEALFIFLKEDTGENGPVTEVNC